VKNKKPACRAGFSVFHQFVLMVDVDSTLHDGCCNLSSFQHSLRIIEVGYPAFCSSEYKA